MADEITTNPQRSERIVDENGLPTDQTIEWFDDIELAFNENLLRTGVAGKAYTVEQLKDTVLPATRPEIPAEDFLNFIVIVLDDAVTGRTLASSNGTDWVKADGNNIS